MSQANVPEFMQPQWFFPLFIGMWLGISALLSRMSGWASLAEQFRSAEPKSGETLRFVSGSMGAKVLPVNYGGCLFVTVNDSGFHLSILFLFRFQSPPLFIPWAQVESAEEKRLLLARHVVVRLRNRWPIISVRGRAGQFIQEAYARAASKPSL